MKLKELIAQNATVGKIGYTFYKAKPGICVATGLVGTGVAVYFAWRAGRKTEAVLEEVKNDISAVKAQRPKEVTDAPTGKVHYIIEDDQLEKSEYNRALIKAYFTAAYKLGKLAVPSIAIEIASIMTVVHGYGLLNDRLVATAQLAQAYAACFSTYRDRVKKEVGEEKEQQLYYGTHEEIVEEPVLDENSNPVTDKKGKVKVIKSKKEVIDEALAAASPFARIFDAEYSRAFETDSETGEEDVWYNGKLLSDMEKMFNNVIRYNSNNIVTANMIYEYAGMSTMGPGQTSGYHGHWENGEFIFDVGDPEGIKFIVKPIYYHDESSVLKKSYIFDLNLDPVKNNILGFYPDTQRTVKELNGQA